MESQLEEEGIVRVPLTCQGRVCGSDGKVNGPGNNINGAFMDWNANEDAIRIRVDDTTVPEFWLELHVPIREIVRPAAYYFDYTFHNTERMLEAKQEKLEQLYSKIAQLEKEKKALKRDHKMHKRIRKAANKIKEAELSEDDKPLKPKKEETEETCICGYPHQPDKGAFYGDSYDHDQYSKACSCNCPPTQPMPIFVSAPLVNDGKL